MYTYEIFETNEGYGFNILQGDNPIIIQEFKPDVDGNITMTNKEANDYANIILNRVKEVD